MHTVYFSELRLQQYFAQKYKLILVCSVLGVFSDFETLKVTNIFYRKDGLFLCLLFLMLILNASDIHVQSDDKTYPHINMIAYLNPVKSVFTFFVRGTQGGQLLVNLDFD